MNIVFLGSCACNYSRYEHRFAEDLKDRFDNDARRAAALLIDGRVMVDCGPHATEALHIAGASESDITDIVITHLHEDHFVSENVERVARAKKEPLTLWVSEEADVPQMRNVKIERMKKFEGYGISNGLKITGLSANHDPQTAPQHLLFEKNGKKLFYGCDGAWMMTETFNFLKQSELDVMIFDATVGDYEGDYRIAEHNSIPMIRLMIPSLKAKDIVVEKTKICLSHIAPRLHKSHVETAQLVEKDGLFVAYDGMEIDI